MLDRIRTALCSAALALAAVSPAKSDPVVVELFTSQGCSSCPPADALLDELADREDVIALSLHVDYWDYLGWADIHAREEFTRRQIAYRDVAGERSVYTPQIVVNGSARVVGSRRDRVLAAVATAAEAEGEAKVSLSKVDEMTVEAEVSANAAPSGPCSIWVLSFETPPPVEITRGENAGRSIRYRNVVRSLMRMGVWNGETVNFRAPIPEGADGLAVIVQDGKAGPIMGAAKIDF